MSDRGDASRQPVERPQALAHDHRPDRQRQSDGCAGGRKKKPAQARDFPIERRRLARYDQCDPALSHNGSRILVRFGHERIAGGPSRTAVRKPQGPHDKLVGRPFQTRELRTLHRW